MSDMIDMSELKALVGQLLDSGNAAEASAMLMELHALMPENEVILSLLAETKAKLESKSAEAIKKIRDVEEIEPGFYNLMQMLESMTEDEIYNHILSGFNANSPENQAGIEKYLRSYPFWGDLNIENKVYGALRGRARVVKGHRDDLIWLYERLADARSKNVLFAIISSWVNFDYIMLGKYGEREFPEYYHPDIFPPRDGEVFVDLGAFNGDSIAQFVKAYGMTYKFIYGYEIAPDTFRELEENLKNIPNIDLRKKAAGAAPGSMFVDFSTDISASFVSDSGESEIEVVCIDDDITEPVTFIKMDIEGGEKDALIGCKRQIRENHPRLAICTYHGYNDIYTVPRLIDEIVPGYKFYMRYHGGDRTPTEYSLLAAWDAENGDLEKAVADNNKINTVNGSVEKTEIEKVVIVGLHQYGEELYRRIKNLADKYQLICFCDTTGQYVNTTHFGIKVIGVDLLAELFRINEVDKIIVAYSGYSLELSTSEVFKQLHDAGITDKVFIVPPWFFDGAYDFVHYSISPFVPGEEITLGSALSKADMSKAVLGFIAPISNLNCNNSCKACVMASPLAEPGYMTMESYRRDIDRLKQLYWHICRFRITGGEPLLHPDIAEMVKIARQAFPATGLAVQTNATLLLNDEVRFEQLFKVMRDTRCGFQISVYKPIFEHRQRLDDMLRKNGIQWHWGQVNGKPVESFSVWRELSPKNDMNKQYDECYNTKYCHGFLDGYVYPCGMPIPVKIIERHFNVRFEGMAERLNQMRMDIHATEMDGWEIVEYLQKPTPACEYCCFEKKRNIEWQQCSREDAKPEDYFL